MSKIKFKSLTLMWVFMCLGVYLSGIMTGNFELSEFITKAYFMGAALVVVKLFYQQED